jgi:hypothetical protein
LNLPSERRGGQVQLIRGPFEAEVCCHAREDAQGLGRGEVCGHAFRLLHGSRRRAWFSRSE